MLPSPKPKHLLLVPLALFLAIEAGLPMAAARNAAAFPLIGQCPAALVSLLGGYPGAEAIVPIMECSVGILVYTAIPGVFGIFLTVMRSGGSPAR